LEQLDRVAVGVRQDDDTTWRQRRPDLRNL